MAQAAACLSRAAAECGDAADNSRRLLFCFLTQLLEECGADGLHVWEFSGAEPVLVYALQSAAPGKTREAAKPAETGLLGSVVSRSISEGAVTERRVDGASGSVTIVVAAELVAGVVLATEMIGPSDMLAPESGLGEVLADLRRRELTGEYRKVRHLLRGRELLLGRLHSAESVGDLEKIAGGEFGAVFGCRRVVLCRRCGGGRWQAITAAGQGEVNRRSEAAAEVERDVLAASGQAGRVVAGPPLLRTGCRVVPVSVNGNWQGAQLALHIENSGPGDLDEGGLLQATRNLALAYDRLSGTRRRVSGRGRQLLWWSAAALLLIGLLLPQELRIAADGVLQPVERQTVCAPESGQVEIIEGAEGRELLAGDRLLVLRSDELQLQAERVLGELAAAQARLAAIESLRSAGETAEAGLLNSEQAELTARVLSLQRQREILERRMAGLTVRAPLAGRLLGAEFARRLVGRPVQRGQRLCEVVNTGGRWELKLRIAERDVGYVSTASLSGDQKRPVAFLLEADPGKTWQASGGVLGSAVELGSRGNLETELTVPLEGGDWCELRPGSGVKAVISCGRQPAVYVWFRRLFETLYRASVF